MFRPVYVSGRVRWLHFFVTFVITCVLLSAIRYHRPPPRPPSIYDYTDGKTAGTWLNDTLNEVLVTDEASYLKDLVSHYGLSENIPWYARRMRPSFKSDVRNSMTDTGSKFMARDFQRVQTDEERLHLHAEKAIHLNMGRSLTPDNLDVSSLIFGISSSYGRLTYADDALIRDWARWLTDGKGRTNGASLVLTLHRATNAEVSYLSAKLRELGIDAVVLAANEHSDVTSRYIELMHMLSRRNDELSREGYPKKFLALVDDDVFFPSLGKLLDRLTKFSESEKVYLGMPSERADWTVESNITLTYGGGAVFFNNLMTNDLIHLPCLQESEFSLEGELKPRGDAYWDEHIYKCISQHTDEDMHVLPSFYVPEDDYHGLRTGFEGGVQPLALHHYRHRHRFEAWKAHMVSGLCGEDCFLQRFFFRDSWILVNGHSISHYPDGVEMVPMPRTSRLVTQQDRDKEREVKTAARLFIEPVEGGSVKQRKVVSWTGVKRTWRLLDARMGEDGEVWQAYVKRRGSPMSYGDEDDWMPDDTVHSQDSSSDEDSVIMLIWEP
ncbi:hypothetical protein E8E14_003947 [Neopestalotiopsis sp. 37M]|nr:hypothetical protein E8E14_003947 [Neopestalotiopsis sp. 37M]